MLEPNPIGSELPGDPFGCAFQKALKTIATRTRYAYQSPEQIEETAELFESSQVSIWICLERLNLTLEGLHTALSFDSVDISVDIFQLRRMFDRACSSFSALFPELASFEKLDVESLDPYFGKPIVELHIPSPANTEHYRIGHQASSPLMLSLLRFHEVLDGVCIFVPSLRIICRHAECLTVDSTMVECIVDQMAATHICTTYLSSKTFGTWTELEKALNDYRACPEEDDNEGDEPVLRLRETMSSEKVQNGTKLKKALKRLCKEQGA